MRQAISEPSIASGDIAANRESFARALRAENKSPKTIYAYCGAVEQFEAFLREKGMPLNVADVTAEHIREFITHLLNTRKPTTAHQRHRGLQSFWKWLIDEGEITESPMSNVAPPKLPELEVPVLSEDDLKKLLGTCASGKGFTDRRDHALLRVFVDTGARLAEVTNLRWTPGDPETDDVRLNDEEIRIIGKGSRERRVGIGNKTIRAVDRYLRLRSRHPYADTPWFWLGLKGKMTDSGVRQVIRRRGKQAGFTEQLYPHQLRHSAAHAWLSAGGSEGGLMQKLGWKSRAMLQRYASSTAQERAKEEHKRLGLGDRL